MKQRNTTPPRIAQKLLLRFLRADLAEEVLGDLDEKFYQSLNEKHPFRAKANYWFQVLNYVRPFAIRRSTRHLTHYDMYQTYFKIGWRNLLRQKMYSFIKIGGFAFGIAVCLLISLYIKDELSYDQNLINHQRVFRIYAEFEDNGTVQRDTWWHAPFASTLKIDYPEVEDAARINAVPLFGAGSKEFRRAEIPDNSYDDGFVYADASILKLLEIPMVDGSTDALNAPKTIVLSRRKAKKYFLHENPIGKLVVLNNDDKNPFTVTGVMEDRPSNSHFQYDFLITLKDFEFWPGEGTSWCCTNYQTYVLLKPGTNPRAFQEKVTRGTIQKYILPQLIKDGVPNPEELLKKAQLGLQPIADIHLDSHIKDGLSHTDRKTILIFGGIALFVLVIACINFINLSTAKSANRAREVGIRKVVGSVKQDLIQQFLTESMIVSLLAFLLGLLLASLLIPSFNTLVAKSLSIPYFDWHALTIFLLAIFGVGVVAGLYPSFFLSHFKPIEVMKGSLSKGSKGSNLRGALVVFQFTISIVLIVGTLVISQQMNFVLNQKIGFVKDQVLILQGTGTLDKQIESFKNELKDLSSVQSVTVSDYLPVKGTKRNGNTFRNKDTQKEERGIFGQNWVVDVDYVKTMGMQLVAGRNFDERIASDSAGAIINQAMARQLNLSEPVGKLITNGREYTVLGVVEDFHFETMRQNVEPLMMRLGKSASMMAIKLQGADMAQAIDEITNKWKKFSPHQPIRYSFLDESYAAMYDDVQRTRQIFTAFSLVAIAIACLGLFALSAFMIEQRTKEIGIRLVLGASVTSVFRLLTFNFLLLVFISIIVATPIAWYLMNRWLQDFAYRVELSAGVFVLAGLSAVAVALGTVGYQSWRAGLMRPVESLRSE